MSRVLCKRAAEIARGGELTRKQRIWMAKAKRDTACMSAKAQWRAVYRVVRMFRPTRLDPA